MKSYQKNLSANERDELISTLQVRFEKNKNRHNEIKWSAVEAKLHANTNKLWSLQIMESTGGEPDVICFDKETGEYIFYDCSAETPKDRRSLCYDKQALDSRKENKPKDNVTDMAEAMGIQLLSEEQYRALQGVGNFDSKTSSWLNTPADIRKAGGAIFGDFRYGNVFIYHNGAESYYAARGFRGSLRI